MRSQIFYGQDKLEYQLQYINNIINISSPNKDKTNFNLDSKIQLKPFYFNGDLTIKNKKVEKIIDNILLKVLSYDESFLGNFNGKFKIKFDELNNKLIKQGEIDFTINEKKIILDEAKFKLDKIGYIDSKISFVENNEDIKFASSNRLYIENYIEFAKIFQIGSKKTKNIKQINFDLVKNFGETDFTISNVKINGLDNDIKSGEIFIIKNIQNLRSYIRKVID